MDQSVNHQRKMIFDHGKTTPYYGKMIPDHSKTTPDYGKMIPDHNKTTLDHDKMINHWWGERSTQQIAKYH